MKTPFERALARLLADEGGFVNDPRDPGGPTNMGVTLATLREAGIDINGDGTIDIDDIRVMTPDVAGKIARSRYWDPCRCEEMPSLVGELLFDFAYHSGQTTAIRALQRAAGVTDDGQIGRATLHAVMQCSSDDMAQRYLAERTVFMQQSRARDGTPLWPTYAHGWMKRLFHLSFDVARVV